MAEEPQKIEELETAKLEDSDSVVREIKANCREEIKKKDGHIEAICGELNIDINSLLTQEQVEDTFRCDDGSEYAGDDYMGDIGWRWNEFIQRWIDRNDLDVASNVFEDWGAEQFAQA